MKTFALLGHPVGHSLSPQLHNAVFQALGMDDCEYTSCDTAPEDVQRVMAELKSGEYAGFSVTIPHKQAVMPFCDELSERAQSVGAVNTLLRREGGSIVGDNTDYLGFEKSLEEAGVFDEGPGTTLVLGTGGAARAVVAVLLDHGFQVMVAARNTKGKDLGAVQLMRYEELDPSEKFSLIVNTTPLGMSPNTDDSPLEDVAWFTEERTYVDIVYNPRMTKFLQMAEEQGARVITGDRMFLWQAVEQAKLFTGQEEVPVEVMEGILKKR